MLGVTFIVGIINAGGIENPEGHTTCHPEALLLRSAENFANAPSGVSSPDGLNDPDVLMVHLRVTIGSGEDDGGGVVADQE